MNDSGILSEYEGLLAVRRAGLGRTGWIFKGLLLVVLATVLVPLWQGHPGQWDALLLPGGLSFLLLSHWSRLMDTEASLELVEALRRDLSSGRSSA